MEQKDIGCGETAQGLESVEPRQVYRPNHRCINPWRLTAGSGFSNNRLIRLRMFILYIPSQTLPVHRRHHRCQAVLGEYLLAERVVTLRTVLPKPPPGYRAADRRR